MKTSQCRLNMILNRLTKACHCCIPQLSAKMSKLVFNNRTQNKPVLFPQHRTAIHIRHLLSTFPFNDQNNISSHSWSHLSNWSLVPLCTVLFPVQVGISTVARLEIKVQNAFHRQGHLRSPEARALKVILRLMSRKWLICYPILIME